DALDARGAGCSRVESLRKHFRCKSAAAGLHQFLQVHDKHLANELVVEPQSVLRGYVNQLCRLQGFSNCEGDAIGIDAVRLAVAIKSQWWNDGNNRLVQ